MEKVSPRETPVSYALSTPHHRLSDLLKNVISSKNLGNDATKQGNLPVESRDLVGISNEVEQILKRHFPATDRNAISAAVRGAALKYTDGSSSNYPSPALSFSTTPESRSPAPRTVRFSSVRQSQGTCLKCRY